MPEKRRFFLDKSPSFIQYASMSRGRAVVARQAHNLKVGGSIPPPATKKHFSIKSHSWDFFVHGNRTRCYSKCHLRHFSGSIPPPPSPKNIEKISNYWRFFIYRGLIIERFLDNLVYHYPHLVSASYADRHCSLCSLRTRLLGCQ